MERIATKNPFWQFQSVIASCFSCLWNQEIDFIGLGMFFFLHFRIDRVNECTRFVLRVMTLNSFFAVNFIYCLIVFVLFLSFIEQLVMTTQFTFAYRKCHFFSCNKLSSINIFKLRFDYWENRSETERERVGK